MMKIRGTELVVAAGIAVLLAACPPEYRQLSSSGANTERETVAVASVAEAPEITVKPTREAPEKPDTVTDYEMDVQVSEDSIIWLPPENTGASYLSLRDPYDGLTEYEFAPGQAPSVDAAELPDGLYVYDLTVSPGLDAETAAAMDDVADDPYLREVISQDLIAVGLLPEDPIGQSGSFLIANGAILPGDTLVKSMSRGKGSSGLVDQDEPSTNKDQVILDDLIVDGSACIGFDCVNGESFGFDTIRIKENNLRIKAQDTSSSASFPTNDWQITFNETSNGGKNKFSIDDIDGGRTPFTIEAGAPTNSLYVEDGGRLGLGTSTPVTDIHTKSGNTPTLRLDQDGSSGFGAQTWDVAGNEANFFIRDASNGSTLPFRIFPGAPSNALTIEASTGDIGLGTTSPTSKLNVKGNVLIEGDAGQTTQDPLDVRSETLTVAHFESDQANTLVEIQNTQNPAGSPRLEFRNIVSTWTMGVKGSGDFGITDTSSLGASKLVLSATSPHVTVDGDLDVTGVFSNSSDKDMKTAIESVDPRQILQQVVDMPISTWRFKKEDDSIRHLGPMAQDFMSAFDLGRDERRIASVDADGVSLAAIQGLNAKLEEKDAIISQQTQTLEELMARVSALERAVQQQ
jgi:hypothetical protein